MNSQRKIKTTLITEENVPTFIKFEQGFWYKFSLKSYSKKIASEHISKAEAQSIVDQIHEKVGGFSSRYKVSIFFLVVYSPIIIEYFYFIIERNLDNKHTEENFFLQFLGLYFIWLYMFGTIALIWMYIRCVQWLSKKHYKVIS